MTYRSNNRPDWPAVMTWETDRWTSYWIDDRGVEHEWCQCPELRAVLAGPHTWTIRDFRTQEVNACVFDTHVVEAS